MILVVGKSRGDKQVNKNPAKEKSADSNKKKKMATKVEGDLEVVYQEVKAEGKSIDCYYCKDIAQNT